MNPDQEEGARCLIEGCAVMDRHVPESFEDLMRRQHVHFQVREGGHDQSIADLGSGSDVFRTRFQCEGRKFTVYVAADSEPTAREVVELLWQAGAVARVDYLGNLRALWADVRWLRLLGSLERYREFEEWHRRQGNG
ncbi:MAG: hypothetical protein M1274_04410 [Actinobacteria bacterium]|nr:hypothetical protein [Actinomycetota bacterium]